MLTFYKTENNRMCPIQTIEPGCWVNLLYPTEQELAHVSSALSIDDSFLRAALDEEETPRIEMEDNQTLFIIDVPTAEKGEAMTYSTFPIGIIVTQDNIITVSLKETSILTEFSDGLIKNVQTALKTRFIFTLLLRVANRYLLYLRQIDRMSNNIERQLYKSQRNKELIQLLDLEKSLVYFTTSLKANEVTLEKDSARAYTKALRGRSGSAGGCAY